MKTKVHPSTYQAAYLKAKEHTGDEAVQLRPASSKELAVAHVKAFDNESVTDAVVACDSKGNEYLLGIYDDARTAHLNYQSSIATAIGLVPIVGPPVAAMIALKDVVVASVPLARQTLAGEATHPEDRAVLRMGLKHLGLSTMSMATHGAAHYAMAAVEVSASSVDFVDSTRVWKEIPRTLLNALKTLLSVRCAPDEVDHESLRVVVLKQLKTAPVAVDDAGNPEQTAAP